MAEEAPQNQLDDSSSSPKLTLYCGDCFRSVVQTATETAAAATYCLDFPPGYRFSPFDEELILHYLQKKVLNQKIIPPNFIPEVNLYMYTPMQLSAMYERVGGKDWYFFTPRDRKYPNGSRPSRAAGSGFWKATAAGKPIKARRGLGERVLGFKKSLVFRQGKPPKGIKTKWIMYEYTLNATADTSLLIKPRATTHDMRLDDWVLCKMYEKEDKPKKGKKKNEGLETTTEQISVQPMPPRQDDAENNTKSEEDGDGIATRDGGFEMWQLVAFQSPVPRHRDDVVEGTKFEVASRDGIIPLQPSMSPRNDNDVENSKSGGGGGGGGGEEDRGVPCGHDNGGMMKSDDMWSSAAFDDDLVTQANQLPGALPLPLLVEEKADWPPFMDLYHDDTAKTMYSTDEMEYSSYFSTALPPKMDDVMCPPKYCS